ncbi:MAG: hypothetical protein JO209_00885 [Acidisphaera sp.]|nr:hypothetical protein [Acidisphaera sp.]
MLRYAILRHVALLACGLTAAPGPAVAQQIDMSHGGPIEVTASQGMDWLQNQQEIVARGDARAVRGDVTVTGDQLIAHYRKKGGQANAPAQPVQASATASPGGLSPTDDTEGNEIYRLDAVGSVHIFTPTDQAWGDRAVYDMDQAVLVLTGRALKVQTPQEIMTARDDMEYWSQKHMAVGRGNAVVITNDGRRLAADTLVGYTTDPNAPGAAHPQPVKPVAATRPGKPPADPLAASGKLQRVEAFGNVEVRTATETVYGDRAVYVPDTGIAHIVGHVRITRGQNQVNGVAAVVNMRTGISTLLSGPSQRVQGMIMPNDAQAATQQDHTAAPPARRPQGGRR